MFFGVLAFLVNRPLTLWPLGCLARNNKQGFWLSVATGFCVGSGSIVRFTGRTGHLYLKARIKDKKGSGKSLWLL